MKNDPTDRQSRIFKRLTLLKQNKSRIPGVKNPLQIETGYCIIKHCTDLYQFWGPERYRLINKAFLKSVQPYSIAAVLKQCLANISEIKNKFAYFWGLVNDKKKIYCITQNYYDEHIWPLIKARQEGTRDSLIKIEVYFINELYERNDNGK